MAFLAVTPFGFFIDTVKGWIKFYILTIPRLNKYLCVVEMFECPKSIIIWNSGLSSLAQILALLLNPCQFHFGRSSSLTFSSKNRG